MGKLEGRICKLEEAGKPDAEDRGDRWVVALVQPGDPVPENLPRGVRVLVLEERIVEVGPDAQ